MTSTQMIINYIEELIKYTEEKRTTGDKIVADTALIALKNIRDFAKMVQENEFAISHKNQYKI